MLVEWHANSESQYLWSQGFQGPARQALYTLVSYMNEPFAEVGEYTAGDLKELITFEETGKGFMEKLPGC